MDRLALVLEPRQDLDKASQEDVAGDEQEKQHQHGREQPAGNAARSAQQLIAPPGALNEEARESAGLAAEEVQQHQPGEDGETHLRSPSGGGFSGPSSLPIARIDRLKASGCWRLLVGETSAIVRCSRKAPLLPPRISR